MQYNSYDSTLVLPTPEAKHKLMIISAAYESGGFAGAKLGRVPLGMSFYTLQALIYIIDVYRGKIRYE